MESMREAAITRGVMAGFIPAIHVLLRCNKIVDGRA